jgi:hypothetical protein
MELVRASETSVYSDETTPAYIPEALIFIQIYNYWLGFMLISVGKQTSFSNSEVFRYSEHLNARFHK